MLNKGHRFQGKLADRCIIMQIEHRTFNLLPFVSLKANSYHENLLHSLGICL